MLLPKGVPKNFLIKIKKSNRRHGTYTQFQQMEKGLHYGTKTFPHQLNAAAITRSDVKLFEKGPSDSFDFYLELFWEKNILILG